MRNFLRQQRKALSVFPKDSLYVSEPNPAWFGNGHNEADNPRWTNANWLKSRFHFSFAEHTDGRPRFGVLRVMNDDLVQPQRAFAEHPHSNMEIITYVVNGELTHEDSMGMAESLGRGSIQYLSAGTGIRHSEANRSDSPLRIIQMWIVPNKYHVTPNYGSKRGFMEDRDGRWDHLIAPLNSDAESKARVQQDVNIYATEIAKDGGLMELELRMGRQAYVLQIEGSSIVTHTTGDREFSEKLGEQDAVEVRILDPSASAALKFTARGTASHLLVVEMSALTD